MCQDGLIDHQKRQVAGQRYRIPPEECTFSTKVGTNSRIPLRLGGLPGEKPRSCRGVSEIQRMSLPPWPIAIRSVTCGSVARGAQDTAHSALGWLSCVPTQSSEVALIATILSRCSRAVFPPASCAAGVDPNATGTPGKGALDALLRAASDAHDNNCQIWALSLKICTGGGATPWCLQPVVPDAAASG